MLGNYINVVYDFALEERAGLPTVGERGAGSAKAEDLIGRPDMHTPRADWQTSIQWCESGVLVLRGGAVRAAVLTGLFLAGPCNSFCWILFQRNVWRC